MSPPNTQNGAPPPYSDDLQINPGCRIHRHGTPNRANENQLWGRSSPGSQRYTPPAIINERSGLLSTNAEAGEYPNAPQRRPPKQRRVSLSSAITIILLTYIITMALCYVIADATRDELDPVARERVRREWKKELQNHRIFTKHVEAVRAQWVRETEEHERQKKMEEEQRRRAGMHWEELIPSQRCLGYGTREYNAKLVGIPWGYNMLSVCRKTEAEIHGRKMLPQSCENRGPNGLWAKWVIDFQEPTCTTWWSNLVDKGCTAQGSRTRRFEQHLENIMWGDDWKVMCTTAPTDFHNRHFDSPTSCAHWGKHGVFGYWDIGDDSC